MKHSTLLSALFCTALFFGAHTVLAQCEADFDFGKDDYGVSPDATQGEQFDTAYVDEPYYDVMHVLVPIDASSIDPELPAGAPIDSIIMASVVLTDTITLLTYSLEDIGLSVQCNNNGDSSNPCTFLGGDQYCASIEGTPTQAGVFGLTLTVNGWTTIFSIPIAQEIVYDNYILDVVGPDGVGELARESFAIYPNPTSEVAELTWTGFHGSANKITVRDLTGRAVQTNVGPFNGSFSFVVSDWNDGVYFVTIEGNAWATTRRLIVQH